MKSNCIIFTISLLSALPPSVHANVKLPSIFSEHAVFQKTKIFPIWGTADPNEKVTVTFDETTAETKAAADGKWKVSLDLSTKGHGPFELTAEGKNKVVVNDILVGEVWVCSGQSNMDFPVAKTLDASTEIPNSTNSLLRQFLVKKKSAPAPQDDCEGQWMIAGPKDTGSFTAVGYYFGKNLQQELKVPIGLVHASLGGSAIEAWMNEPTLDKYPDLKQKKDNILAEIKSLPQRLHDFQAKYDAWIDIYKRQDRSVGHPQDYASPSVDTATWKTVKMPGSFLNSGLPDSGVIWIRRKVNIPAESAGKGAYLDLGIIDQFETVYWNGKEVGKITSKVAGSLDPRRYLLPGNLINSGDNILAMRIFSPKGNAGIKAETEAFRIGGSVNYPLSGEWQAMVEFELPTLDITAKSQYPENPHKLPEAQYWPSGLFNGMINPIIPYAIEGVIWYQGETNATRAYQYRTSFPAMIKNWRAAWGQGDFPFYWCQLANFTVKKNVPIVSSWAELREAQTMALALNNTGQAILIDSGEEGDIHPRDKKSAGDRLSRIALSQTYGKKDVVFAGPLYQSMAIEGDKVRVRFKNTEHGLTANPLPETYKPRSGVEKTVPLVRNSPQSELEGFTICGEDKQWKWANAKIENETVIVWSSDVPKPIAVRYAWATNPTCNLYNKAGLPAVPFRTDDFPITTLNGKY